MTTTTAADVLADAKDSMIEKIVTDDAFRRENKVRFFHVLSPFNPLTTDSQFAAAFAYQTLEGAVGHASHRYGFLRMFDGLFRSLGIRTSPHLIATVIAVPAKMYDPTMPDGVTAMAIAFVNPKEVGSRAAGRRAAANKLFSHNVHFTSLEKVDSIALFKTLIDGEPKARTYALRLKLAYGRRDD